MPWSTVDSNVAAKVLDELARIGDPDLARVRAGAFVRGGPQPDPERIRIAYRLFGAYANEICAALLLAALPQAYATTSAVVLYGTGQFRRDPATRLRGTAQFLLTVMMPGDAVTDGQIRERWGVHGDVGKAISGLRDRHQEIRTEPKVKGLVAVNQEDLLGTLLMFTVTTFEVLEQFGITWTQTEQDAYLHVWDLVGARLGIGSPGVAAELKAKRIVGGDTLAQAIRPRTVADARALLAMIRLRKWPPPRSRDGRTLSREWHDLRPGRVLTRSLLDSLQTAMPPGRRAWPLGLMRYLNPQIVRDRLAIGGGGLVQLAARSLPGRRATIGPFTSVERPNPLTARAVHAMANEVTRQMMLTFVRSDTPLTFPGLEQLVDDLSAPPYAGSAVAGAVLEARTGTPEPPRDALS